LKVKKAGEFLMRFHKVIKFLPSVFTLGNILCGFLAINNVVEGSQASMISAAWWIIIAGIFDALDGKIARITNSSSEFGIELDSIADVIIRFSQLCMDLKDTISEVDINPLMVFEKGKGAKALDALVVTK